MSREFTADLLSDSGVRRVLVMCWRAMGDVALASAAIGDLARAFLGCEMHLNALPLEAAIRP